MNKKERQAKARARWTAALRSGRYKQGKNRLATKPMHTSNENEYCCLGVACEEYLKAGGKRIDRDDAPRSLAYRELKKGEPVGHLEALMLPEPVRDWLGLCDNTGTTTDLVAGQASLTALNDNGMPFSKIADIIDAGSVRTEDKDC
jgi:hypothetical protein